MTRAPIRRLPADVAARIAAGEVIDRPASVVKELVENALDAGARSVRIEVRGGGLGLIRVSDDGMGIPAGELGLACQRHATSKLTKEDLSEVRTLGFRGEALASIAAMAELTLASAADDSGVGRRLLVRDRQPLAEEPVPRPRGTTVTVRHLFQNVPARLSAARRLQAEGAQVAQVVRRLALAAPHVSLSLQVEDRLVLRTSGAGPLETALLETYGPGLAGHLLPLGPVSAAGARLHGFLTSPEVTRPGRAHLHVLVNGRWVQPRALLAMLEAAYRPLLPRGRHPVLALVLELPPGQVDINIHPSKHEVRLLAEHAVGRAAADLLRGAIGGRPRPLELDVPPLLETLGVPEALPGEEDGETPILTPGLPPLRLVGQVQDRLVLLEGPDGLYLVDQHRAHERILYERLRAAHAGAGPEPVALAEPLLLELGPAQAARFSRRLEELAALGFQCEAFGGRAFLLRAAPVLPGVLPGAGSEALTGLSAPDELLQGLLALADEEPGDGEGWAERLFTRLACRTAVRRGRALERAMLRALVAGLGHTAAPAVCPHGSPLLLHVSGSLLERQFHWR